MSGIWLLLWIVFVFSGFGYGAGRAVAHRQMRRRPGEPLVRLTRSAAGPVFAASCVLFTAVHQTLDQAVHAGWLPETAAMRLFLAVGGDFMGAVAGVFLVVVIVGLTAGKIEERRHRDRVASGGPR